jgi:hypothetical protein
MKYSKMIGLKSKVLTELRKTHVVLDACSNVGLARSTFYRWCSDDKEFSKCVNSILSVRIKKPVEPNRLLWRRYKLNKNRKWYQFWIPEYIGEYHYLVVKDGFVCLGRKK